MEAKTNRIIWALDPFHSTTEAVTKSLVYLEKFASAINADIEPVYVLSPHIFFVPTDYFIPPTTSEFLTSAQVKMQGILAGIDSPRLKDPLVIYDDSHLLKDTVQTFISHAQSRAARHIFATTHARSGLSRVWLGSFVEALIMHSKIPVITLNPATQSPLNFTSILFATDLGGVSKESLLKLLPLAKKLEAKIFIFHVLRSFEGSTEMGTLGLSDPAYSFFFSEYKKIKKEKLETLEKWQKLCAEQDIAAEIILEESEKPIPQVILQNAKNKGIRLIALSSLSGPVENFITGGVARQIVRHAECPVWVAHG